MFTDLNQIIKKKLCIGCGLCSIDTNVNRMVYNKKNDCYIPYKHNNSCTKALNICPGKGYSIVNLGNQLFGKDNTEYDIDLGFIHSYIAAHSTDKEILKNASSGGIITATLEYLLNKNIVDKVSVTQFECDKTGVKTKTFLSNKKEDIIKAQGSKYCPVNLEGLIKELHEYKGKVAIVATPCAIAGIRNIQKNYPDYIKSNIIFTIANFCGGFKSFKNISSLAKIHKIDIHNLKDFRFRGGGQPGSLRFIENNGKEASTNYPKYVGLNGYSKMYRCHVCPDATGELADIACGDAWIKRFEKDKSPWSMIICRNVKATTLLQEMSSNQVITTQQINKEEIKLSQHFNLTSKKKRQKARMNLYTRLGYKIPIFDGGYYSEISSMKTEWIVYAKHKLTLWAEKIGVYMILYGRKKLNKKQKS